MSEFSVPLAPAIPKVLASSFPTAAAAGTVSGVVTLSNWTMMPDGRKYLYVFSHRWQVTTDRQLGGLVGDETFRSAEKWQLVGFTGAGVVGVVIPGCGVKGLALCEEPPGHAAECFVLGVQS